MKILYLIDSFRPGGKERQAADLLRGLAIRGNLVQVVSMGEDRFFAPELEKNGIPIHYVTRSRRWDPRPWWTMDGIVRLFRPDVIHTSCWMTSFYAYPICLLHGVPLVNGSIRNSFARGGVRWHVERLLLKASEARIANCRAGLRSRGFDPEVQGNYVVYNGFDQGRLDSLDSAVIEEIRVRAAGRKIVGMVAQFKKDKDYESFLEAARRIINRRDDALFITVGDGMNFESLKRSYAFYKDRILFLGRRLHVESIISCFFLGVLTTLTEGIPNAIMEIMAAGKPVIATDVGGTSELVEDGITGLLIPVRDVDRLEQGIEYFLDRPDVAAKFGERGRTRIRQHFSWNALIGDTMAVYARVASPGLLRQ